MIRKLLTYLLRLTYSPYEEIPQPRQNESLQSYLLRSGQATIHINIRSKKRDTVCLNTWRNAQNKEAAKVFCEIYNKHKQ